MKKRVSLSIFAILMTALLVFSGVGWAAPAPDGETPDPSSLTTTLAERAVKNAKRIHEAPYLWGGKGRHWDPIHGHSAGEARWATPQEIKQTGYRWRQEGPIQPGIDCSGLIMWAYNKAHDPAGGYLDPANPILKEGTRGQWDDTDRMKQRFIFTGPTAVTDFLDEYSRDPGKFGLRPGDPIYFLNPTRPGIVNHVVMYIGKGYIIHATWRDGVIKEPLATALQGYTRDGDWFHLVGLGRVKATIDDVRPTEPSPRIVSVISPHEISLGETAKITVRVKNEGEEANWQTIAISFPQNPSYVKIIDHGLSSARVWWPGEETYGGYSTKRVTLKYPLAEGYLSPWPPGKETFLKVEVRPEKEGDFIFYVKTVAGRQPDGKCSAWDPTSGRKDQQDEYVRVFKIRVVPPPQLSVSPTVITGSLEQETGWTDIGTVNVTNPGGGTLIWSAASDRPWIIVTPSSGTTTTETDSVTVRATTVGLTAGTHEGTITFTGAGMTRTVDVTLTVTPPPPELHVSPTVITGSLEQGTGWTDIGTVNVTNPGGGTLIWSAASDRPWIIVTPSSGTTTTETDSVTVRATTVGLTAGTHEGTITFTGAGMTETVDVTLTVTALPQLHVSPITISASLEQGTGWTDIGTVNVTNPGGGTLIWSAASNRPWIIVTPSSGTTTTETDSVTVRATTVGLTAGTHKGTITFTGAGMTRTVDVTLTVVPPEMGTIAGRVYLQGRANHSGIIIGINGYSTITNPDGSFSITVAPGTYTVTASMPGYLEATKLNVAVEAGETKNLGTVTLLGGDANADGVINAEDLAKIAGNFNTPDAASDINADGIVDIFDVVLAGTNFGRTESPWE